MYFSAATKTSWSHLAIEDFMHLFVMHDGHTDWGPNPIC